MARENGCTVYVIAGIFCASMSLVEYACAPTAPEALNMLSQQESVVDAKANESHYFFTSFYGCGAGDGAAHFVSYKKWEISTIEGVPQERPTLMRKNVIICCGSFFKACTFRYPVR